MDFKIRLLPYISLGIATALCFIAAEFLADGEFKNVVLSVGANGIFFFIAYLFYDAVRQVILKREQSYIHEHIKRQISSSIFSYLYFLKKVVYGYNLDTNTPDNILGIVNLKKSELKNQISNQSYLGFQIFKITFDIRSLFDDISKDSVFLKFSSHLDSVGLLKISNNLYSLERIYRNPENFNLCAEKGIEYKIIDGKSLNPTNDEKLLLIKTTAHESRFVVYDSGYFDKPDYDLLLNRYVLKPKVADEVATLMESTLALMQTWLPRVRDLNGSDDKFRIIKGFFSERTNMDNKESDLFVADIVEFKKRI